MLPNVAATIIHSSSRAATAVQNQTHTIRNVLQLQSQANTAPSSGPSKAGTGSGPGWDNNFFSSGPRYNGTGSRFQSGYHGASRAVTQASVAVGQDPPQVQLDETEEVSSPARVTSLVPIRRTRLRRSSSVSVPSVLDQAEKSSVLKTVQLHARSRHAFAAHNPRSEEVPSPSTSEGQIRILTRHDSSSISHSTESPSPPSRSRSYSTSAEVESDVSPRTMTPPPPPLSSASVSLEQDSGRPSTPPRVIHPVEPEFSAAYRGLITARDSRDPHHVAEVVSQFRSNPGQPSVLEFNAALEALYASRGRGEPLAILLETYNDMLSRALQPDLRTYTVLLRALLDRDHEVNSLIRDIQLQSQKRQQLARFSRMTKEMEEEEIKGQERIQAIQSENNWESALKVYRALAQSGHSSQMPTIVVQNLLRSCAQRPGSESAEHALFIWAEISKLPAGDSKTAVMYKDLLEILADVGGVQAAREVFDDFKKQYCKSPIIWRHGSTQPALYAALQVWNAMIGLYFRSQLPDEAVALVGEMIASAEAAAPVNGSKIVVGFNPNKPPAPSAATFTAVLKGFVDLGDLESASSWFTRLVKQPLPPPTREYTGLTTATRPSTASWRVMMQAYLQQENVDDVNALAQLWTDEQFFTRDTVSLAFDDIHAAFLLNVRNVQQLLSTLSSASSTEEVEALRTSVKSYLDFTRTYLLPPAVSLEPLADKMIWDAYLSVGFFYEALNLFRPFMDTRLRHHLTSPPESVVATDPRIILQQFVESSRHCGPSTLADALLIARYFGKVSTQPSDTFKTQLLHVYALESVQGPVQLQPPQWELMLRTAIDLETVHPDAVRTIMPEFAFTGLGPLLQAAAAAVPVHTLSSAPVAIKTLVDVHGLDYALQLTSQDNLQELARLVPSRTASPSLASESPVASESTAPSSPPSSPQQPRLFVDKSLSNKLDDILSRSITSGQNGAKSTNHAIQVFHTALSRGKVPTPYILGKLCQSLGRLGDADSAKRVYSVGQDVLGVIGHDQQWQTDSWFLLEDSMVIALCQAGDLDGAHLHRMRLLEQGQAPSADAYGGLILAVKDTTDDTANAYGLWQESQARGVQPNQYLYNNIISKLAKARKADHALELFHQMQANGVEPSSITYGALIGACARVGDAHSAEALFAEMVNQRNFKPRVPPYNTMMQLYTTAKPNRERALWYHQELVAAGVKPSAHTVKLLMDAYTLEPVDIRKVEELFREAQSSRDIGLQPFHFSAIINAYGCVLKDLNKALEVFNSIPNYRAKPGTKLLDATVVETMINAAVAHRRMDLVPGLIETMTAAGVHMTAYIVNSMIKGYAVIGDLEQARSVFESLSDPAHGLAAMHNHAPHNPELAPSVDIMEPVYREPSTWEVMIRAELGAGQRENALALLERLRARQYPDAVFNRISGILVDHSLVLPANVP